LEHGAFFGYQDPSRQLSRGQFRMPALTLSSPESAGMSAAALERIEAHLKRRYIDEGRFPGTQLLVYRRGKLVHCAMQGFADLERKIPVKRDTIFRIYSMTKPITSVAFMMLVEEGRVALDEPVTKYIPQWQDLGVFVAGNAPSFLTRPPSRTMLIIDLLRHTSGLTYGFQQRSNVDAAYRAANIGGVEKAGTLQSMIDDLAKIPLEFSPGEAWNYSLSTDVIGYLIEKIAGQPFEQFLKERIFDPLGMDDTGFHVPPEKALRLAACYSADPQGAIFRPGERKHALTLQDDPATSSFLSPPSLISGGGGLCSTAGDYLTFCRALLHGGELGGVRLLSPKTLALMTANHLPGGRDLTELSRSLFSEASYSGIGFGLGFQVTFAPAKTLMPVSAGEYGWGGAASTVFWIDPAEELIAIFMTQVLPSSAFVVRRELRTMVNAAITDSNL
jgi:CubicO group peptidase (beta-lactamase class C family)